MKPEETANAPKLPTKEEMMAILQEKLEVVGLQLKVQEVNTRLAELRLAEVEALAKTTQFQGPQDEVVQHIVTQEDLDSNEELRNMEGVKVGVQIGIPKAAYNSFLEQSKPKQDPKDVKLKKV